MRIRVTRSYFYILLRLFVRVDDVKIRLRESRIHHCFGEPHSLRQYTEKEGEYAAVRASCTPKQVADGILDDPDQLSPKLKIIFDTTEIFALANRAPG